MESPQTSRLEQRMAQLTATFTAAQARHAALSSRDLAYMVREGRVFELSRGVYRDADAPESAHLDLLAINLRAPNAVVCGESALALHELIDDIPAAVHIAVPRGARRPSINYPPVVVAQYASATFDLDIEHFEAAAGESVRIYSAARSVVDAMRHRRRHGESLALSALGRYLRAYGQQGASEIQRVARELGALPVVRPSVEAVLA
jgi:predicted transcriptional regulator of viral defense system